MYCTHDSLILVYFLVLCFAEVSSILHQVDDPSAGPSSADVDFSKKSGSADDRLKRTAKHSDTDERVSTLSESPSRPRSRVNYPKTPEDAKQNMRVILMKEGVSADERSIKSVTDFTLRLVRDSLTVIGKDMD